MLWPAAAQVRDSGAGGVRVKGRLVQQLRVDGSSVLVLPPGGK